MLPEIDLVRLSKGRLFDQYAGHTTKIWSRYHHSGIRWNLCIGPLEKNGRKMLYLSVHDFTSLQVSCSCRSLFFLPLSPVKQVLAASLFPSFSP